MRFKRVIVILKKIRGLLAIHLIGSMLAALCSGCATTGYLGDRMRDAGDVFTATVGVGAGGKVRVGPLDAGLLVDFPVAGVKCGKCFVLREMPLKLPPAGDFQWILYEDEWFLFGETQDQPDDLRLKNFSHMADITEPVDLILNNPLRPDSRTPHWSYLTQIEAVVGLGPTIRLGFNPAELLDFLLGWTTVDIFKDDLKQKKANKISHGIVANAPNREN